VERQVSPVRGQNQSAIKTVKTLKFGNHGFNIKENTYESLAIFGKINDRAE
jgi:hypothetical protein